MLAVYHWFWRLAPANPLVVRIVEGGSARLGHLWVRLGYLSALIVLLIVGLMGGDVMGNTSLTELAKAGTWVFTVISYGQVVLVCLLAPLFMAGAIAQEQAGETFDILLTTPLSNLQIVLGMLLGRLFFVLALLASGLPLFAVLMVFGGVPVSSVFVAFAVAGLTALMVGSVAVTMAVLRKGGRKVVYLFVIAVAGYLLVCYGADRLLRAAQYRAAQAASLQALATGTPGSTSGGGGRTTVLTGLHPVLVLETYFNSANYQTPRPEDVADHSWLVAYYLSHPLTSFTLLCLLGSLAMILWSALRVRHVGAGEPGIIRLLMQRWLHMGGVPGERRRRPRTVSTNPIAWREAHTRGNRIFAVLGRWGLLIIGLAATVVLLALYHHQKLPELADPFGGINQSMDQAAAFRFILQAMLLVEVAVVVLVAVYLSAGSVSREREDGTLDLLLTTPVTPRQYLWGKLRGLVSFLSLLLALPLLTIALVAGYSLLAGPAHWASYSVIKGGNATMEPHWLLLPETALLAPFLLVPFVALCVAMGMNWSLKSKGVMGAVVPAVGVVGVLAVTMGFCGYAAARNIPWLGAVLNAFSPTTNLLMLTNPWEGSITGFADNEATNRVTLAFAALLAAGGYSLVVYWMIQGMVRTFDHTVRRLSGAGT